MKKLAQVVLGLSVWFAILGLLVRPVQAETIITPTLEASLSAEVLLIVEPTVAVNLTESKGKAIESYKGEGWNGFNSLKVLTGWAIEKGVSTNTLVLLLLLPLVATLVSFLHYVVGLSGYGIFMPTMIAVAFLATGVFGGLMLFAIILIVSILSNLFLRKLRLHFWPARAIRLTMISITTFLLMVFSSFIKWIDISQISIFPILFMILLAEEFSRTQLVKSKKEAKKLTIGTIILAVAGGVIMNFSGLQDFILNYPDLIVLLVVVVNLLVGNYTGIRWSEIGRFKKALREKK
jgi:uncharacterized membrane protein